MFDKDLYDLTQNAQGALFQAAVALQTDAPQPPAILMIRRGYAESPGWLMVQAAEFDPEPLNVQNLRVRAIWSSERIMAAILELLAGEKWLDRVGEDYHLTEAGRESFRARFNRTRDLLIRLEPHLPMDDINRLESLLRRVLDACQDSWCLRHSRNRAPGDDSPAVVKLFHYGSDLNAYRDDTHMDAIQPYAVEGYVWEAFSVVDDGSATTAEAIYDQFYYRGYSRLEYAGALSELVQRGWVEPTGTDAYQSTEEGRALRLEAERRTDDTFYAPWKTLAEGEAEEIQRLLQQMTELSVSKI